ncbi:MAG TPA: FmdB family zinc ribbon protein [Streptosporangiaceae bacterium]|nr:FmdB family zinc ribbon protein [Streptosporangiaceae bacterium]
MPTYQYACTSCGEQLEAMQRFSDDPLTVCPACEGALRKVFSPVGIVFKGSGFYRTDSRKSTIPTGDKNSGDKNSGDKSGDKDKVASKVNGSGDGSSSGKSSSDSGSSSSDSSKSADKKPAKTASAGSSS